MNSGKNDKKTSFFFQSYNKCLISEIFFVFVKSYSASHVCLQRTTKKALFLFSMVSIDHLFDNLELGKRNDCFEKRSGKSREFWIPKSVRSLMTVLLSSKLCNQRVTLVNTLIPLFWK